MFSKYGPFYKSQVFLLWQVGSPAGRSSKEKCVEVLDPYNISVELWIDDVSRWPPIEFPHVYTYLIDTPG